VPFAKRKLIIEFLKSLERLRSLFSTNFIAKVANVPLDPLVDTKIYIKRSIRVEIKEILVYVRTALKDAFGSVYRDVKLLSPKRVDAIFELIRERMPLGMDHSIVHSSLGTIVNINSEEINIASQLSIDINNDMRASNIAGTVEVRNSDEGLGYTSLNRDSKLI